MNDIATIITVMPTVGRGFPNITIENARFWGRPNFKGEMDRFKDDRRKFTVIVPNDTADQLRALGYNVRTTVPENPEQEPISSLKVMVDPQSDVYVIQGEQREKLTLDTVGILDSAKIETIDMEVRGWEYNAEDNPGQLSARLVTLVAVLRPSILGNKYQLLG